MMLLGSAIGITVHTCPREELNLPRSPVESDRSPRASNPLRLALQGRSLVSTL